MHLETLLPLLAQLDRDDILLLHSPKSPGLSIAHQQPFELSRDVAVHEVLQPAAKLGPRVQKNAETRERPPNVAAGFAEQCGYRRWPARQRERGSNHLARLQHPEIPGPSMDPHPPGDRNADREYLLPSLTTSSPVAASIHSPASTSETNSRGLSDWNTRS